MTRRMVNTVDELMIKYRKYGELLVAAVLLIFFLGLRLFINIFINLTVERWRFVSPAVWPNWVLIMGIILSALLFYNAIKELRSSKEEGDKDKDLPEAGSLEYEAALREEYQPAERKALSIAELEALADARAKIQEEKATASELIRLVSVLVLTFIYLYLIRIMGFITSTFLFSFAYLILLKERRLPVIIVSPILLVVVIWYIFTQVLVVPLPRGIGFFMIISNLFY
jgi:hypothetical protein